MSRGRPSQHLAARKAIQGVRKLCLAFDREKRDTWRALLPNPKPSLVLQPEAQQRAFFLVAMNNKKIIMLDT
jgi:hypothetical protein